MRKKSTRKFFLFGRYSIAILPPKKWLTEFGIKPGDLRVMELDRARKRLVINLSADSAAEKNSSKTTDWQPIPKL